MVLYPEIWFTSHRFTCFVHFWVVTIESMSVATSTVRRDPWCGSQGFQWIRCVEIRVFAPLSTIGIGLHFLPADPYPVVAQHSAKEYNWGDEHRLLDHENIRGRLALGPKETIVFTVLSLGNSLWDFPRMFLFEDSRTALVESLQASELNDLWQFHVEELGMGMCSWWPLKYRMVQSHTFRPSITFWAVAALALGWQDSSQLGADPSEVINPLSPLVRYWARHLATRSV